MNPLTTKYKAALLAGALLASAGAGWVTNGWRLGKTMAKQESAHWQAKARRGQDYADALARAAETASGRITEAQALLQQARAAKAKALRESAQKAPTGPEFACRDKSLPEDYLETFRQ